MQTTINEQFEQIERYSNGWRSLPYIDRSHFEHINQFLENFLLLDSDKIFSNFVFHRRTRLFDFFQSVSSNLLRQWLNRSISLLMEERHYLTLVGLFYRRLTLTLQNDNEVISQQNDSNVHLQKNVRELLFDTHLELFEILMNILPTVCDIELDLIEMLIPWYEALIFFEHSYTDASLSDRFLRMNERIVECLNSLEYERSLILLENQSPLIVTVRHRFILGLCTMSMGVHVNSDDDECEHAKRILEIHLPHYISFIHHCTREQSHSLLINALPCLTGIVTYLVNYTLTIDTDHHRQLLEDLFSLCLYEEFYPMVRRYWSTYETILLDSIICYLIIYCYNDMSIVQQLIENRNNCLGTIERLIETAEKNGNRRIAITSQLLLLILASVVKDESISRILCQSSFTYIELAVKHSNAYHYNRIPMSMFFKSLLHTVKLDFVRDLISKDIFDMIVELVRNSHIKNPIYQESIGLAWNILWSISFHDSIRKKFHQLDETFFDFVQTINLQTKDLPIKQATCGLLYNLDRLDLARSIRRSGSNYGKTIGISFDPLDRGTVEMLEYELNKAAYRVWTSYDQMDGDFLPTFASMLRTSHYLIVCLSDFYRSNNRCRSELLYAMSSGHHVLSWTAKKAEQQDEISRIQGVDVLLRRISSNEYENVKWVKKDDVDGGFGEIYIECRSPSRRLIRRRTTKRDIKLEDWSKYQVRLWCQSIHLGAFEKLIMNYDGQSVIKLYEFCKSNSVETISALNKDLRTICHEENLDEMEITVHEYIRFQLEVEKVLSNSTISLLSRTSTSLFNLHRGRSNLKICTLL